MTRYREHAREVERETRWTIGKFLGVFLIVLTIMFVVGFGLNSLGLIGRTVVEREVFEQSYQRSEALKARIATDEAALAQIQSQLRNPSIEDATRRNLEAQRAAIEVRLEAARRQQ